MSLTDDDSDRALGQRLRMALKALPDAPPALQRAALALWPAPAPGLLDAARTLLGQINAALSFDSWMQPLAATGMRSRPSPTRQLLFSGQGRDVDLRIAPEGQGWSITGQVLGPDEDGWVELVLEQGDGSRVQTVGLDALGEFRLPGLGRGRYALSLHLGADTLVLPPVSVGEELR